MKGTRASILTWIIVAARVRRLLVRFAPVPIVAWLTLALVRA